MKARVSRKIIRAQPLFARLTYAFWESGPEPAKSAFSMHFRTVVSSLALAVFTSACHAQHLEETGRHRFLVTYDYSVASDGATGRFFLPIPPSTAGQFIASFRSNWDGSLRSNPASPAQRYLAGPVPRSGRVHWHIQIVGTFITHQLVEGSAVPAVTLPRPASFSGTSESLDWNSGAFQQWLDAHDLRRGPNEPAASYARRAYDFLTAHGEYTYPPEGGWTASGAARRLRTDCGGFSLVLVAACRANHVPARLLVGQWLKTRGTGGSLEVTGRQAHVIAEIFDPAIGWIPADVSSGLMHVAGRDDYFGREPGYFFTWHYDTDFHFDVPSGDGHVQWIQNPAPWFAGDEADSASRRWTITPLP